MDIALAVEDGASLAWLYDHGEVVERRDDSDSIRLRVRLDEANALRFERRQHGRAH